VKTNAVDWRVANHLLRNKVTLDLAQDSALWITFLAQKQDGIYYNSASLFLYKSSNNFQNFYRRCRVHSKDIFVVRWRSHFRLPHKSLASENGPLLKPIIHPGLSAIFCSFILLLMQVRRLLLPIHSCWHSEDHSQNIGAISLFCLCAFAEQGDCSK
jgi:hypothetical protein